MGLETIDIARMMKALSDENRLKIVDLLSCGERCACEILPHFSFTQPTLSHHMKVLMECGLVRERKEGKWHHYSLIPSAWQDLLASMHHLGEYKELCICMEPECVKGSKNQERKEE